MAHQVRTQHPPPSLRVPLVPSRRDKAGVQQQCRTQPPPLSPGGCRLNRGFPIRFVWGDA